MLVSELRPYIRLLAPNAPNPIIDMAVVDAARELCRRTHAWRYTLEAGDLSKEGTYIVMSPPTDAVILKPWTIDYADDGTLTPATEAQLTRKVSPGWRDDTGTPTHYVFEAPDTLILYPWLSTISMSDLKVRVSLMPELGVTELPDRIATQHSETIRNGALARLFAMPGRSWTNPQLAGVYGAGYAAALAEIEEDGTDGYVRNLPRKVRYGGY